MKKLFYILIIILIAGLYIDMANVGMYCNAYSLQPTFVVQTIIPFRADRETLLIGYGKKISNFPLSREELFYNDYLGLYQGWGKRTDCPVFFKKDKGQIPYLGDHFHYIDLRFWEKGK